MSAEANTGTVLDRILEARRASVDHRKRVLPETALKYGVAAASPLRDFAGALSRTGRLNILAELKPASPSRGVLRDPFDPIALGRELSAAGAAALSVLTEPEFFNGSRANDADSFLLIVAALSDARLGELMTLGRELKMEPLVEVHTGSELDRALKAGARIVGVNNRDLKTLAVNVQISYELIERIPDECIAVSESGLKTHDDLRRLRDAGFDAFLIGEQLMQAADPGAALAELLGVTAGAAGGLAVES
jgi:indole-3-glycerol phosphate synthase